MIGTVGMLETVSHESKELASCCGSHGGKFITIGVFVSCQHFGNSVFFACNQYTDTGCGSSLMICIACLLCGARLFGSMGFDLGKAFFSLCRDGVVFGVRWCLIGRLW